MLSVAECKMMGWQFALLRGVFSAVTKRFTKNIPAKLLCKLIGTIPGKYDVAISYSQPISDRAFNYLTNEIVLNCVDSKKKATFLHCDFAAYGGNSELNRKLYSRFDCIAAVSDSVGKRFAEVVPDLKDKIRTVYNFCDCNEVLALSEVDSVSYRKTAFITVARLSAEKGLLRCVQVFKKLKDKGLEFEWHIVGGGVLRDAILKEVRENGMEDCVHLEGEQLNPYRHMKNADYFLLPSFHEAAPMVYEEAITLGLPILTTKTLSALELVENRKAGVVCENDSEAIFAMLDSVLSDKPVFSMNQKPLNEIALRQFCDLCR